MLSALVSTPLGIRVQRLCLKSIIEEGQLGDPHLPVVVVTNFGEQEKEVKKGFSCVPIRPRNVTGTGCVAPMRLGLL